MRLAALIFLLLWGVAALLVAGHWQQEQQERLDESSAALATTYRATITSFRLATEILFADVIRRPEVIDTFAAGVQAAGPEQDRWRGRLYRLLAPTYGHLIGHGMQQLQFHTAAGTSFLRFHAPDKSGDSVFATRPSVRMANQERRPVFGFEVGRLNSSFCFVYPLEKEAQHLGSVEVGITFRAINEAMSKIDPARVYLLILRKSALEETLLQEQLPLYAESPIHGDFLVEDPGLNLPVSPLPLPNAIQTLNRQLHDDQRIRTGLVSGGAFALAAASAGDNWVVAGEPINDLRGVNVAYLVSYGKAPFLADLRQELIISLLALTLGLAAFYWLSVRLLTVYARVRRDKQHLQTLTDTIADAVCVMDQHGRVLQINAAFSEILGYPAAEVVGEIGHHLFHVHGDGSPIPLAECPVVSAIGRGTDYSGEAVFRHRDGRLLTVELTCKPFRQKTHVEGSVTAFRDISERKATEARLLENDRIKSEFIATASHELRTPLAAIQGYSELLVEGEGFSDEQQREFAGIVHAKALALERIIDDLLNVSRIETGRPLCLDCSEVDLVAELRQVVGEFARETAERRFETNLPAQEVRLSVDRFKIDQVLENLLNNAVKFSPPGSVITVAAQVENGIFRVSVADQGQGIAVEKLPHIFDKFYRVDSSNTAQPGFGLGLYLVKRIIETHQGQVEVESIPGQGSIFSFTLPLPPGEE